MSRLSESYFKLVKRLFPINVQGTSVGIDSGTAYCKAVEISRKNDRYELHRWAIEPAFNSDEKAAFDKLSSVFSLQSRLRTITASLGGKGTLIRYVDMPRMSAQDLKKAFVIEADKYFPFPKDTVYTDCSILEMLDSGKKMAVLVAAVKKDVVDGKIKFFKDSGFELASLTLGPVAVANAFSVFPPEGFGIGQFKACAVLDIGETTTNLMILSGGQPRFNRDIFIGIQEIAKRVANLAGVSPAEARQLLQPGMTLTDSVRKGIEAALGSLVSEIRLSFDYFVTEKNMAVSSVFLIGEGAVIPYVRQILKEGFDISVEDWNPFSKISMANGVAPDALAANAMRLVGTLGLALNEYD